MKDIASLLLEPSGQILWKLLPCQSGKRDSWHSFAITRFDSYLSYFFFSLATPNRPGQTRSLGASAPRDLLTAPSGISIPIV
jgi:hypothetical protein